MARLDRSWQMPDKRGMGEGAELTSMNVSLSRAQRDFVEAAARDTGCTTTSEYIRRLIHEAQRRADLEDLERKLIDGLESGAPIEVTTELLAEKRAQLRARREADRE